MTAVGTVIELLKKESTTVDLDVVFLRTSVQKASDLSLS